MTNEELILKFYDGDETILEKLYNKNIGFILSIAKEVAANFNCYNKSAEHPNKLTAHSKYVVNELFYEGMLEFFSLLRKKKYEPERAKLTTYFYPRLKGAMYRWMECNLGVLFFDPEDMAELRKAQQLYYDTGKEPEEIAKDLGISIEDVARHIGYNTHFLSVYDLVPYEDGEPYDPYERLMPNKSSASTDRIVYHKLCLEFLKELFEALPKKDREILGHSFALFGYKHIDLDELCLEHMMKPDGIIKARKAAVRKMREKYPESSLRLWKSVYRTVMREAERYHE